MGNFGKSNTELHPLKKADCHEAWLNSKKGWTWDMGGHGLKIGLVQEKRKKETKEQITSFALSSASGPFCFGCLQFYVLAFTWIVAGC